MKPARFHSTQIPDARIKSWQNLDSVERVWKKPFQCLPPACWVSTLLDENAAAACGEISSSSLEPTDNHLVVSQQETNVRVSRCSKVYPIDHWRISTRVIVNREDTSSILTKINIASKVLIISLSAAVVLWYSAINIVYHRCNYKLLKQTLGAVRVEILIYLHPYHI